VSRSSLLSCGVLAGLCAGLALFSGCTLAAGGESPEFNWLAVVMVVVLLILIYFFLIRPVNKRRKEQQKLMATLRSGDQVIAAGGIYGVVESISEDSLIIRVESGAKIRVTKAGLMIKRSSDQLK
jgi:preprotein translocase subunit YajC